MLTVDEFEKAKRREAYRRWREKHRDEANAHTKKWISENRERYNAYHREYYHRKKVERMENNG